MADTPDLLRPWTCRPKSTLTIGLAETAAFLDGIQGARKDLPDLAQGLYIQRVLDAAQAAHDTGHTQEVLL